MKSVLKKILARLLGNQIKRLRAKNNFKLIGVVGSIGKTSTKLAVAKVLRVKYRVRFQEGNYNDILSVPLVFFGEQVPKVWNVFAWLLILIKNEIQIWRLFPFDFVVVELGTDGPGQIIQFREYLHLDVAVLTAITPEHMEFFSDLTKVAEEEWSVSFFSDLVLANKDLCKIDIANLNHRKVVFYGKDFGANYKIEKITRVGDHFDFDISENGQTLISASYRAISEIEIYSITAAIIIAQKFSVPLDQIKESLSKLESFAGRMQRLVGLKDSVIIDDSYNASPASVRFAIQSLYNFPRSHRIAVLGMMNELGTISENEHREIGKMCDPKLLDLVVTIGRDANLFIAPEAKKNGCRVYEAKNSKEAGFFLVNQVLDDAVILVKGSQNGVFAEEAIKPLLQDQKDVVKLVRQSADWLAKKN